MARDKRWPKVKAPICVILLFNPQETDVDKWLQRELRHLPDWTALTHSHIPQTNTYVTSPSLSLLLGYLAWLIHADFYNMTWLKPENEFSPSASTSDNFCELKAL